MTQGCLSAAFALLVWGVTFTNTRALLVDFSALEIMVVRFAVAWVVLWGVESVRWWSRARRGSRSGLRTELPGWCGWRGEMWFAAMGLTGVLAYQFLENCAIYYTNAGNVAILVSFGPIVTAVFARLFTRDRSLSTGMVGGSLVAVGGVALVSLNDGLDFAMRPLGDLMALVAMASWGGYSVLVDKLNERGVEALTSVRKAFGWAMLMMLPLAGWGATEMGFFVLDGSFSVNLDAMDNVERFSRPMNIINFAFLGVLASALAFIAWSKACAALGVVRTTICLHLEPIVGVGFAALFLGERLTAMSAVGGMLIVIGVVVASWRRR